MTKIKTYRSSPTLLNSPRLPGLVCMRRLAVRTNCPTVAEKPARKALNGYAAAEMSRWSASLLVETQSQPALRARTPRATEARQRRDKALT